MGYFKVKFDLHIAIDEERLFSGVFCQLRFHILCDQHYLSFFQHGKPVNMNFFTFFKQFFNGNFQRLFSFDFRSQDCITDIPVLILDDHEIFLQKSVVDLGLSFSSNLAWSKHISDRLKACYIRIISLRRCLPLHLHSQIKTIF